MIPQTSYSIAHAAAYLGGRADSAPMKCEAGLNKTGAEIPYGRIVALDTTAGRLSPLSVNSYLPAKLPSAATDKLLGVCIHDMAHNPGAGDIAAPSSGVLDGDMFSIGKDGKFYCQAEQDADPSLPVYVRFSANGAGKDVGQLRVDADGVAEVHTVTPTATNSLVYVLRVNVGGIVWEFEYQADGTATATEIVTGFKTVMAADAAFSALVVATGTTTLILTGQTAGQSFTVQGEGDGVLADVLTTSGAAKAVLAPNLRWAGKVLAGNPVAVEIKAEF